MHRVRIPGIPYVQHSDRLFAGSQRGGVMRFARSDALLQAANTSAIFNPNKETH